MRLHRPSVLKPATFGRLPWSSANVRESATWSTACTARTVAVPSVRLRAQAMHQARDPARDAPPSLVYGVRSRRDPDRPERRPGALCPSTPPRPLQLPAPVAPALTAAGRNHHRLLAGRPVDQRHAAHREQPRLAPRHLVDDTPGRPALRLRQDQAGRPREEPSLDPAELRPRASKDTPASPSAGLKRHRRLAPRRALWELRWRRLNVRASRRPLPPRPLARDRQGARQCPSLVARWTARAVPW